MRRQGVDGMPPLGVFFTPKDPTLLDYNLMGKGVTLHRSIGALNRIICQLGPVV